MKRQHSLFISDLHLCESRPSIINAFLAFLKNTASKANALYILGDFFEYWAGDDAISSNVHKQTIYALKQLSESGVKIFFMHGNRDFLIGDAFCKMINAQLLPDPSLTILYGHSVLLSHGDALCTDDIEYQAFRKTVRSDAWKQEFLNQSLKDRIAKITYFREKSAQEKSKKTLDIMNVNQHAVEQLLITHKYPSIFIHGHTHRPKKHLHQVGGHQCERWVLGDWYEQGSYLKLDARSCQSKAL